MIGFVVALFYISFKKKKNDRNTRNSSVASVNSMSGQIVMEEDVEAADTIGGTASGTTSVFGNLDFVGGFSFNGKKRGRFRRWFGGRHMDFAKHNLSILGSVSAGASMSKGIATLAFPIVQCLLPSSSRGLGYDLWRNEFP